MPDWMYDKSGKKKAKYQGMKYDYDTGQLVSASSVLDNAMKKAPRKAKRSRDDDIMQHEATMDALFDAGANVVPATGLHLDRLFGTDKMGAVERQLKRGLMLPRRRGAGDSEPHSG